MKSPRSLVNVGLAALSILVLFGCAATDLTSPRYSTQGWLEADVEGIRVLTNARPEVASRSLKKLSRFLKLTEGIRDYALPPEPISLHLFDRAVQYQGFVGTQLSGHAVPAARGYYVALGSDFPEYTTSILFHEVVHLLVFATQKPVPSWYNEGDAEYLAAAILRPGVATLGRAPPYRVETLRSHRPMGLARLFNTRNPHSLSRNEVELYYAEAWAFVHFTQASPQSTQRVPQLMRFLELLESGQGVGPAFKKAFGITIARFEPRYRLHRQHLADGDEVLYRHYVFEGKDPAIEFRPAPPEDVARELAAHASAIGRFAIAIDHYDEVLSRNPDDVDALLGRAVALAKAGNVDAAERAIAAVPAEDPRSREARGILEIENYGRIDPSELEGEEAQSLLAKAAGHFESSARQNPSCTQCWEGIALYHARHPQGDPAAGLKALDKAGAIADRYLVRGELLMRLRRFDAALSYVDRVINATHDSAIAIAGLKLLARIMREQRLDREAARQRQ